MAEVEVAPVVAFRETLGVFHGNIDARGIGLYITKNQIDAMNGKVTVTSEVGKGTTFNIFFNENN